MRFIAEANRKEHVYPTYGRQFSAYRWYKPILVGIVFAAFYMIFTVGLIIVMGVVQGMQTGSADLSALYDQIQLGYDGMDLSDPLQCLFTLGGLAIMIPALWLSSLIVRDRPFSSYSSSRGGWSSKVFWRVFPVAFLFITIPILFDQLIIHRNYSDFNVKFTLGGFIILTILGPLQCIAEEYIFRGLLMQTLGSWFRLPVIAVLLQSCLFALMHPYNMIGKAGILASGMVFALTAWIGRGIEISSAYHICNNMTIFYLQGLNLTEISSESDMESLIFEVITGALFVLAVFVLSRKTSWFSIIKKDDAAAWNEKYDARMARKEAKRQIKFEKISVNEENTGGKHYKQ